MEFTKRIALEACLRIVFPEGLLDWILVVSTKWVLLPWSAFDGVHTRVPLFYEIHTSYKTTLFFSLALIFVNPSHATQPHQQLKPPQPPPLSSIPIPSSPIATSAHRGRCAHHTTRRAAKTWFSPRRCSTPCPRTSVRHRTRHTPGRRRRPRGGRATQAWRRTSRRRVRSRSTCARSAGRRSSGRTTSRSTGGYTRGRGRISARSRRAGRTSAGRAASCRTSTGTDARWARSCRRTCRCTS